MDIREPDKSEGNAVIDFFSEDEGSVMTEYILLVIGIMIPFWIISQPLIRAITWFGSNVIIHLSLP